MANLLPTEKKISVVHMLCEGSSIRAIERITGVHRDTIMRLGVRMGEGCHQLLDEKMRKLPCKDIQVDEVWGFIGAKQKTVKLHKLGDRFVKAGWAHTVMIDGSGIAVGLTPLGESRVTELRSLLGELGLADGSREDMWSLRCFLGTLAKLYPD